MVIEHTNNKHNHGYEALEYKVTSAVRALAAAEVVKGYKPNKVRNNLLNTRNGNCEAIIIAGGSSLSIKDIYNAGQSYIRRHPDPKIRGASNPWEIQLDHLCDLLLEKNWLVRVLDTVREDGEHSHALVFTQEKSLAYLIRRGYLTIMDSTHKTNAL